jgi:DNA-binding response OmpR family regulator
MARILLIDDDPAVRNMLRLTLTHFGHTVTEARDGKEGLASFERARPDLVLTDIVMPEKEGLELLMDLRKRQPPVKVIAMSGGDRKSATSYLHMATLMGASRVLSKPFPSDELLTAIREVLSNAAAPEAPVKSE